MNKSYQAAYQAAIQFLSRREYAAKELADKLIQQRHDKGVVEELLKQLQEKDYQSDARYCEMLVRTRIRQHYGPVKIAYELKQKGISTALINKELSQYEDDWATIVRELVDKKQRGSQPLSVDKLTQFLLNKGFSYSHIKSMSKQ